ncbi:MAG: universal stress protein [Acidiferrobacterales bacterium]
MYHSILLALDSSDHANQGIKMALMLAALSKDASITGTHVYAAKLHDVRFRQMEGGLPEQFREEQELERQRDVHDDLITRGLSIITDAYLDQADANCQQAGIRFNRCSLEGKNYRALTQETNSGKYDLLVMGALGLGAVGGSRLGTVCRRVTRRSDIDTLIIKQPKRPLNEGTIVVAVDGSARAYGGLLTALQLAKHWRVPVKVIAVFDPYFHYVAFNRIADVLSEEAGKVFRFKEQEQLHEDIIDSGLAKIYQGHLDVAQSIAREHDIEIEPELLDGKPHDAISKYIKGINPSLLVIGKLGIHADEELDIGGNAENLLHDVDCAVLLSQREHQPRLDVVADVTTSWTIEAEQAMDKVPDFARNMARMAILRHAQKQGHTVITEKIVDEATAQLCPSHAKQAMAEIVAAHDAGELTAGQVQTKGFENLDWSTDAEALLNQTEDSSVRNNLRKRAEKKARTDGSAKVEKKHLESFIAPPALDTNNNDKVAEPNSTIHSPSPLVPGSLHWQAAALARLMRVPEGFMRDSSQKHIENYAQQQDITEITLEVAKAGLQQSRQTMEMTMKNRDLPTDAQSKPKEPVAAADNKIDDISWSSEALERLGQIPVGMARDMTRKAAEMIAASQGLQKIGVDFLQVVLDTFQTGSDQASRTLPWDPEADNGIRRVPPMVQGMLIREIEAWVQRQGMARVNAAAVEAVKAEWKENGYFHLNPADPRSYGN